MTDPIADMIIRIKNAAMAKRDVVSVPFSKQKLAIAEKLAKRGFVTDVSARGKHVASRVVEMKLGKDAQGNYRVNDVRRVSKPGMRIYKGAGEIGLVRGGTGAIVVSTPKGVLYGDEARKEHVGGEVLFEIW